MSVPEQKRTNDLLQALVAGHALETFQGLPLEEQEKFRAWIARALDDESYWRRIDILVLGMQQAPPLGAPRHARAQPPEFWTNPIGKE